MPAAASLARAALKLCIAGCIALFNYVVFGWRMEAFEEQLKAIYDNWGILYPYSGSFEVETLDAEDSSMVALMWLPLLVAALATYLLMAIPHGTVPRIYSRLKRQIGRVMAWEAYPRRFWIWWCGGMSVRDLIVVAIIIAYNLYYFLDYFLPYQRRLNAVSASGMGFPEPYWQLILERIALTCGIMMWPNIWLLFLPAPQSSFLQALTGIQFTEMIRYHRWIGHVTLWVLSGHAWLYYLYWAVSHQFWAEFSDWGINQSVNNLAGTISYLFGLVLWSTSLSFVRRKFFETFYRCHIVCFLGFTLFAYMHYRGSWTYFLPGLLMYGVDVVLRAGQMSNTTLVTAASVDNESGVATLQFRSAQAPSSCPLHELFLLVPSISRWQWHPFSISGTAADKETGGSILTLNIKRYGKWTKDLMERLQQNEPLPVRVSSTGLPGHCIWEGCDAVVMLGGGIGATPLLSILRDMLAFRAANTEMVKGSLPGRVHFVWASRNPREFCILDAELLEAARASDGWLTIELYSTKGAPTSTDAPALKSIDGVKGTIDSSDDEGASTTTGSFEKKVSGELSSIPSFSNAATIHADASGRLSSPMFQKYARVIQPQVVDLLHLAAVYVLVWMGAFLATVLAGNYYAEVETWSDSYGERRPRPTSWKMGMILFFCQAVMLIGLPYVLAVLPVHLWRYWQDTKRSSAGVLPLAAPQRPTGHGAGCKMVGGMLTACGEAGLEIMGGRPQPIEVLQAVSKDLTTSHTVGVFVGGPEAMTHAVQLEVAGMNGYGRTGPYYAFSALAHSM
ncbi:hypothetical protein D9Q98_005845 [Chlorella vulgaris]|uniref:FAD-binding FR-type domain-containing protein n=1 Tax=Chlorella vulgaris TaxID=3077 RepID=A0A9D4TWH5_CHLVU|nr:hypothetical protein D9Q98_005845 [Chlorella vulgaris]